MKNLFLFVAHLLNYKQKENKILFDYNLINKINLIFINLTFL